VLNGARGTDEQEKIPGPGEGDECSRRPESGHDWIVLIRPPRWETLSASIRLNDDHRNTHLPAEQTRLRVSEGESAPPDAQNSMALYLAVTQAPTV
jgi:hypothetical protein